MSRLARFAGPVAATAGIAVAGFIPSQCDKQAAPIVVIGSLNADIIIEIDRMPIEGETISSRNPDTGYMIPGGKGANQAVAVSRLKPDSPTEFVCQFGSDSHGRVLRSTLEENQVGLTACGTVEKPSGQAFILLNGKGQNSIILSAAANAAWPKELTPATLAAIQGAKVVMLQREIPEYVNEAVAAAAKEAGALVIQDVGGEERPMTDALVASIDYLFPNETELARLTGLPTDTEEQIVLAAKALQAKGCKNVGVTLGSEGSILLTADGQFLKEGCLPIPGGKVVDTTGAGDSYRAAFAVAILEGRSPQDCMRFAAATGAITVSRHGAIPSLPTRREVEAVLGGGEENTTSVTATTVSSYKSSGTSPKTTTKTTTKTTIS